MKICFIPIDNRPVCYDLPKKIVAINDEIEIFLPPIEYLGDLKNIANTNALINWLEDLPNFDIAIVALDTIAYGGLIPSRRSKDSTDEILNRLYKFKNILSSKKVKVFAFSSIMRISNNNYNEEEKEYWSQYGKKIFDYSYHTHKNGGKYGFESCIAKLIPDEILDDYLGTRRRNFEINKTYLEWEKEGFFETLIFSKDDCAEFGFNVMEAIELENLGATTKTGADEIPLTLLSRAIKNDKNKVFTIYTEPSYKDKISNYEDISIEKSVNGQLELGGFKIVDIKEDADIILLINNFIEKQGEHVMGWDTTPFYKELQTPTTPYAVADVRFANGADNNFIEKLLPQINLENFYGYSAWNTSANTLGSLIACMKVYMSAEKINQNAFKNLQLIRFLDDWAYQANVRKLINKPSEIKYLMQDFEHKIFKVLNISNCDINYSFPWDRTFEIRIKVND